MYKCSVLGSYTRTYPSLYLVVGVESNAVSSLIWLPTSQSDLVVHGCAGCGEEQQ